MRTCINHAIKIEEALADEELTALVPEVIARELYTVVDGEKFNYDVYAVIKDVTVKSGGCPFCYIENELGMTDYVDGFIERMKKGDFEWAMK